MRRLVVRTISLASIAVSIAVGITACQVHGEVAGQFACVEEPRCPGGFTCLSGVCVENPDGGTTGCATTDQLGTSFDDTMLPWWAEDYTNNGGTVAVTGGEVVMTVPANTTNARAQISTYSYFDLRGRTIELEVSEVGSRTTEVELEDPSGAAVYFGVNGGNMFVYSKGRTLAERPYSATTDRWWRARGEGMNVVVETSPDGAAWNHLATDFSPLDLAWVEVELSLQGASGAPAGTARWSTISPTVDPTIKWCPMSAWTESITDNVLPPHSDYYGDSCTVEESSGTLKVSAGKKPTYCVTYSNRPVDARDSALAMEVVPAPEPGWTRIALSDRDDRNIVSMYSDDRLHFYVEAANVGVLDATAPRNPAQRFWRIALAGSQVRFEVSPDGTAWETLSSTSAPMLDATALFMERTVFTNDSGTGPLPVTATFGARIR